MIHPHSTSLAANSVCEFLYRSAVAPLSRVLCCAVSWVVGSYKEEALHVLITEKHAKADNDHHHAKPHEQRTHLESAYIDLIGLDFGLTTASKASVAKGDRFVSQAMHEISNVFSTTAPDWQCPVCTMINKGKYRKCLCGQGVNPAVDLATKVRGWMLGLFSIVLADAASKSRLSCR